MSWADIKRRYEKSGGMATQSTEDMAARRILRAIGLTEAKLWTAEKDAGIYPGANPPDKTLLERAISLARLKNESFYPAPRVRDVRSFKEAEDTVMELVAERPLSASFHLVSLVYRIKGADDIRALVYAGVGQVLDLSMIPLPCVLRKSRDGEVLLCDCDAQDFYNLALRKGA